MPLLAYHIPGLHCLAGSHGWTALLPTRAGSRFKTPWTAADGTPRVYCWFPGRHHTQFLLHGYSPFSAMVGFWLNIQVVCLGRSGSV